MSEKAKLIQDQWNPGPGDRYFISGEVKTAGNKTRTYVLGCHWDKCDGCRAEVQEVGTWLPTIEQLQKLFLQYRDVHDYRLKASQLIAAQFYHFVDSDTWRVNCAHAAVGRAAKRQEAYIDQFSSLNELWLAFVMSANWFRYWLGGPREWRVFKETVPDIWADENRK